MKYLESEINFDDSKENIAKDIFNVTLRHFVCTLTLDAIVNKSMIAHAELLKIEKQGKYVSYPKRKPETYIQHRDLYESDIVVAKDDSEAYFLCRYISENGISYFESIESGEIVEDIIFWKYLKIHNDGS